MKWIPNTVGTHHAFDCGENRRSRTNGVSNVNDTHEPALSLLYNPWHNKLFILPAVILLRFVSLSATGILIKAHFERRETRQ